MRKNAIIVTTCLLFGCATDQQTERSPNASCYRHISNHSQKSWTFQAFPSSGNVWFYSDTSKRVGLNETPAGPLDCKPNDENGPCSIAPGSYVAIKYTQSAGLATGSMHITDVNGVTKYWAYSSPDVYQCPSIEHGGDTGAVSMNDPSNGDYNIEGNNW